MAPVTAWQTSILARDQGVPKLMHQRWLNEQIGTFSKTVCSERHFFICDAEPVNLSKPSHARRNAPHGAGEHSVPREHRRGHDRSSHPAPAALRLRTRNPLAPIDEHRQSSPVTTSTVSCDDESTNGDRSSASVVGQRQ